METESLLAFGFNLRILGETKLNVLSVTKKTMDDRSHSDFHIPITGIAAVRTMGYTNESIVISRETMVTFQGRHYPINHVRNGMAGTCLVIGILRDDEPPYELWELYTDTPSSKPDRSDEVVTPEIIRKIASKTVKGFK